MSRGPIISRRRVGMYAAAAATGALAPAVQAQRPGQALVHALPVPCGGRPGDITGLLLEGIGPASARVVSFGMPFRAGELGRDAAIAARSANGREIPAQLDVTVRHADGSARHAVVTLVAPALANGTQLGVVLSRAAASGEAAIDTAGLDGRTAVVELVPHQGGTPWQADLIALSRASAVRRWQSGPLATQWRVAVPVPPSAIGGATSMRLVADIALRSDGTLWVDVWFRNDIAMRPGGGTASYVARVLLDGREALRADMPAHHQYRAWGRLLGAGPAGTKATPPPLVRHDATYLADTGAVARYDLTIGIDEALFAQMERQIAEPSWATPFATRGVLQYMPTSGGRLDLGPTTGYQAAWLMTGDRRAAAYCVGQAETAGTIPWHFWDVTGGSGSGGWLDARRWPRLWTDKRGGKPPRGLEQPIPEDTGWVIDSTHQPAFSFIPYLLTGRRAFADEVMAQGAWNVLTIWPAVRNPPGMSNGEEGFLVVQRRQVRGAAWSIRQLDEAAWSAPDGDANQSYLRDVSARNWAWLRAQIPEWTRLQGEPHGWLVPAEFGGGGIDLAPWQQDYLASAVAAAARQGNADARAVLAWMANFLVGRFESADRGFARRDGAAYQVAMGPGGGEMLPLKTWSALGDAMRARGFSNGEGWAKSQGEYGRLALQSLAQIADVLDHEGARRAYAWLVAAQPPFTDPQSRSRNPTLNIVPRRTPRSASCAAPARG